MDVIPAGTQHADRPNWCTSSRWARPGLRLIYSKVRKDRIANVRVRLALGAEVPRNDQIAGISQRCNEYRSYVRRYRFLVTGKT